MAELFSLQFAADLSDFTSEIDTHGDLIWNGSAGASPDGSTGCAQCIIDDQTAAAGIKDHTIFTSQTHMRGAFYVDVGDMALTTNDQSFQLWSWRGPSTGYLILSIIRLAGVVNMRHSMLLDSAAGTITADIAFTTLPDWIEVWATKATNGTGANDAISRVYFGGGGYAAGGQLMSGLTISGRDFFDAFTLADEFRIGATNVGTGITASGILLDNIRARDDATPIFFVDNAAPTITAPATQYSAIGVAFTFGNLLTEADTDGNLDEIRLRCTESLGDIGVTLSGGVTVSAGANNSHDMTLTGTQSALGTVLDTAAYTATADGSATITVDVTDDADATNQATFTIRSADMVVIGSTQAILNGALNTFTVNNAVEESVTLTVIGIDDAGLEDSASSMITFENLLAVVGANPGIAAIRKGALIREMRRNPNRWRR